MSKKKSTPIHSTQEFRCEIKLDQKQYDDIDKILLETESCLMAEAVYLAGLDFDKEHSFDLCRAVGRSYGTLRSLSKIRAAREKIRDIAKGIWGNFEKPLLSDEQIKAQLEKQHGKVNPKWTRKIDVKNGKALVSYAEKKPR